MKLATAGLNTVPAPMIAVPLPSPSGMSPTGALVNSASSWGVVIFSNCSISYAVLRLLKKDRHKRVLAPDGAGAARCCGGASVSGKQFSTSGGGIHVHRAG